MIKSCFVLQHTFFIHNRSITKTCYTDNSDEYTNLLQSRHLRITLYKKSNLINLTAYNENIIVCMNTILTRQLIIITRSDVNILEINFHCTTVFFNFFNQCGMAHIYR